MPERFTGFEPTESKELSVKDRARATLDYFRAKFGKGERASEKAPEKPAEPRAETATGIKKEEPVKLASAEAAAELTEAKAEELTEPKKTEKKKSRTKKERGDEKFVSTTTEKYFENWDELELEGNDELMETIRENIKRAEERNKTIYEDAARDLRISVEEFKEKLQARVEDMVKRANFFRATRADLLEKILLEDGRWKSQFETGTSEGTLDSEYRAVAEASMFGFGGLSRDFIKVWTERYYGWSSDQKATLKEGVGKDKEQRPIYGYFSDDEFGAINNSGKIPPPTSVIQYGQVNFKIKKDRALAKSTLTFHDSLGPNYNWPPTPAAKPHFSSFRLNYNGGRVLKELTDPRLVNWGESYTEVQYHGGLTLDDVEAIYISEKNNLNKEEIERIREVFAKYKKRHPESTIQLIEF